MRASHISTSSTVFPIQHRISAQLMLIMTTSLLPNARRTPGWKPAGRRAGRNETGDPLRGNALDPGFYGVLSGLAQPDCDADGAGVS